MNVNLTSAQLRTLQMTSRALIWGRNAALAVSASLFVAVCAHVSVPLPGSPVPVSLVNFAVLLVGLVLGPRLGAAALGFYLVEGAAGLPFFSPTGPGGTVQLLGPTGGFLMAYPVIAFIAGSIFRMLGRSLRAALLACLAAELALFASGAAWLEIVSGAGWLGLLQMSVLPFIPGEVLKTAAASLIADRWHKFRDSRK